ncbi:MAG: hypothetical protein E7812_15290 [Phenylobacterium sp.]|nr:MAG: hypothetical protein E7812_15290 [Phenylobacterium sp.]
MRVGRAIALLWRAVLIAALLISLAGVKLLHGEVQVVAMIASSFAAATLAASSDRLTAVVRANRGLAVVSSIAVIVLANLLAFAIPWAIPFDLVMVAALIPLWVVAVAIEVLFAAFTGRRLRSGARGPIL